jgi:acyl-coenzyme A thioesterase PaaI-like protein
VTARSSAVRQTRFSEVAGVTPIGAGRFEGEVDADWTIAGKPNGGYLLAMLGRAAAHVSEHHEVAAASAHYLRAPDPGPVLIETEVLRNGRAVSQVRARLRQDGSTRVEALVTTGRFTGTSAPYWNSGLPGAGRLGYADRPRLIPRLPNGMPVAIMDQVEVRLEPESMGFPRGEPSGRGEIRGWLALPGGESFETASLLYAVDAFPPATFDIEFSGWVPTLELTVYVRARPSPGPVQILQRAQLIDGNRVDESCFVWDGTGRLVAQGTQLAAIRLGSRPLGMSAPLSVYLSFL